MTCIWGPSAMLPVAGMVLLVPCLLLPTLHRSTLPGRESISKHCRLSLWLASWSLAEALGGLEEWNSSGRSGANEPYFPMGLWLEADLSYRFAGTWSGGSLVVQPFPQPWSETASSLTLLLIPAKNLNVFEGYSFLPNAAEFG